MVSVWEKESFFAPQDVVIAGSGFAGLWAAFFIKKKDPSAKITILDRGYIPAGASTRNAGFACFGSLSELVYDSRQFGTDDMLQLVEKRYRGLQTIRKYFKASEIDFELTGGYELYEDARITSEELQSDIDYMNTLLRPVTGKKKTFSVSDDLIKKFGFQHTKHLVENKLEGYLHSGKLLKALVQHLQSQSVQVLNGFEVMEYVETAGGLEIKTNHNVSFSAQQLLVCTNAFAKQLLPALDIVPARGQVLLTTPIKNLPWKGTFHSEEGFYYFRNLGDRVLLGGARHKAFDEERSHEMITTDLIQTDLENYLDKIILPDRKKEYKIEQRWSGIMAMGGEKLPIVKQIEPRVFCAVRMSGMGVALAPVVGQEVALMMAAGS
jgi:gamma-glutamylputrescine oxidase